MRHLLVTTVAALLTAAGVMGVTAVVSRRLGRLSVVDVSWGLVSALWWGLWLVAAEAWPGVLTVVSPVVMTYVLAFATGARLLESEMAQRPGYRDYMERTPMFLPRPPGRRPAD